MIKGNTKIQLFDAKTGEEVQCVEKHNMVTNAVTNLLNPPTRYMTSSYLGNYEILNANCPIKSNAMAGILLWDETIEENADIVMPPSNVKEVGHAGGAYSGTFKYRGTLNSNETGDITNGKRFVWDFGTDRANGAIKCVSLTSLDGGNCGFTGNSDDLSTNNLISNMPNFSNAANDNFFLGEISKYKWAALKVSGKTVTISYYNSFNENVINLSSTYFNGYSFIETKTITLSNSQVNMPYYNNYGNYVDNNLILHVISCPNYNSNKIVNYAKINIISGELISEQQIVLSNVEGYGNIAGGLYVTIYNNKIYAVLSKTGGGTGLIRFGFDGEFEVVLRSSTGSFTMNNCGIIGNYFKIGNILVNKDNDHVFLISSRISNSYVCDFTPLLSASEIYPNMLVMESISNYPKIFARFNPYLATINNLATPVVKTSAQTMKITYEITESTT